MKAKGEIYIQEKDENNLGIYFLSKINIQVEGRKNENWGFICWLTKNIYLCFMENKTKIEGRKKRIKFNVIYELIIIYTNL